MNNGGLINGKCGRKYLTLTRVVFESLANNMQAYIMQPNLTLTRVVFEFTIPIITIYTNINLTLTRVVFEFPSFISYLLLLLHLTLTSVVQKNKSCNKENFSMLQLFY